MKGKRCARTKFDITITFPKSVTTLLSEDDAENICRYLSTDNKLPIFFYK